MNETKYHTACLSHAQADEDVAKEIAAALRKEGVIVAGIFDAPPGGKLHRFARDVAVQSDRLIVVCSKQSKDDGYVNVQIDIMLARELRAGTRSGLILPLLLPSAKSHDEGVHMTSDWSTLAGRSVERFTPGEPLSPRLLKALQVRP
jgi:hypothetical protein